MKPSRELVKQEPLTALEKIEPPPPTPQSYNYGVDPNADNEVHLLDYWRAIRKRLWMVIGVVALSTMLATVYVARKPDSYEAEARVQVNLEDTGGVANSSRPLYGPADDPIYFNTQLQILSSPGLMRRVVRTLDLEHNPDFFKGNPALRPSMWQTMRRMVGLSSTSPPNPANKQLDQLPLTSSVAEATAREDLNEAKRLEPFVNAILGGLKVEPVKETRAAYYRETRLIDIEYSHTDPHVAAKVVNAIAETYAFANLEKRTETNSTTGVFLQKRIAELQQQIRTSEEQLVNYARNNQIVSLDPKQNTVVERLVGLNQQLLEAENERKTAEAAYNAANAPGAANALADADTKQANDIEAKLIDLRQKRASLLVDATEEAPEVKEVDQQITELEKQRTDVRGRKSATLLTNLNTRYQQALQREQSLRKAFEEQRAQTLSQSQAEINYRIIQQEIETNKQLLNGLLQGAKENDVVLAGKPNNISIVDYALPPDSPVGPNRTRTVLAAFFLSIGAGLGLALLLEHLDDTVHSTEDVERLLHLPALTVIPSVGAAVRRPAIPGLTALQKSNGNNGDRAELLMNVDGRSPLAEAYRHLRTSVLLSTPGGAPRSLLVTSSLPGEGKTTTAVNTAISLVQTGASVVIIDADMRRPRLQTIFDMHEQEGLSSILSSDTTEADMLELIKTDEATGLNILTSGPIPPNPAELVGSDQMRRLMTALQARYTYVVVDSPPISSFTDGVLIATMVDGVLLVVHGGKSSRHIVRRSKQLLSDVGSKVFGVVLNNVNVRSHDYYYYQSYYGRKYYAKEA